MIYFGRKLLSDTRYHGQSALWLSVPNPPFDPINVLLETSVPFGSGKHHLGKRLNLDRNMKPVQNMDCRLWQHTGQTFQAFCPVGDDRDFPSSGVSLFFKCQGSGRLQLGRMPSLERRKRVCAASSCAATAMANDRFKRPTAPMPDQRDIRSIDSEDDFPCKIAL